MTKLEYIEHVFTLRRWFGCSCLMDIITCIDGHGAIVGPGGKGSMSRHAQNSLLI